VIEAGAHAQVLLGKQVLVGPVDPCGECDVCRRGGAAVCPLAKRRAIAVGRVQVAARWVVALDHGLTLPAALAPVAAGELALAYTLYARTGVGPKEPVIVVGSGTIARFLVEILLAKSIAPIAVSDDVDWLLGKGAVAIRDDGPDDGIRAKIAGALQDTAGRPWRVIACTAAAVARAAALAGPRATLTVLAPVPALPGELVAREVTVIGVAGAHPDLVVEAAALCARGQITG
jgi:6-hydroxycyclohex-1-ene-1-carbonyl-CoA dehydrogenase